MTLEYITSLFEQFNMPPNAELIRLLWLNSEHEKLDAQNKLLDRVFEKVESLEKDENDT